MLCSQANAQKAELLLYNASIYTLDEDRPFAEALAIANGRIIKVGSNKDLLRLKGKQTRLIDAKGHCVIPGLFDSHLHVIRGGRFYNAELRWDGVKTLKRALAMLTEQAARTPAGQWIRVVGGWNAYQFEEKRLPTLDEINRATGNTPTFILHLYGHAYLNKAGLKALGMDGQTASPPGGLIEKDSQGNPTGLLLAEPNAFLLYSTLAKLPELKEEEKINSTLHFMRELNRLGITAVMDAGGGFQNFPGDYGTSEALCTQDSLRVRLPYFLFAQKAGTEKKDYEQWIRTVDIGQGCADHEELTPEKVALSYRVQGAGENLVMSAADFENFDQPRPVLPAAMEEQLKEVLMLLVKNRWPFRLHATYDESITRFLNVIESVDREIPLNGLLWFFDHAETVSLANLQRIKKLGGGIAIQHRMAYQGESFIRRYGKDAAAATPPVRKMLELGIPVGMGSDGTRVSSYNPFVGLYWLCSGKTIGGTAHMSPESRLDRLTALQLYTQGSARLIRTDHEMGKIKEGYLADIALLNQDYFKVEESAILSLESLLTILNGKIVYAGAGFDNWYSDSLPIIPDWSPVRYYGGYQTQ